MLFIPLTTLCYFLSTQLLKALVHFPHGPVELFVAGVPAAKSREFGICQPVARKLPPQQKFPESQHVGGHVALTSGRSDEDDNGP